MPKVDFKLKEVSDREKSWELNRDCVAGEEAIKKGKEKYLPIPTADRDTDYGRGRYAAYVLRAVFYNVTGRTLEGLVGQVFSEEAEIDLPTDLERYVPDIDGAGTTLVQQAKATMLTTTALGHCGLLSDYPAGEEAATKQDIDTLRIRPRIILIQPEKIINWRVTVVGGETLLSLVVIEETAVIGDDDFEMETEPRWRELRLVETEGGKFAVVVTVWRKKDKPENGEKFEVVEGFPSVLRDHRAQSLDRIPFEFVGSVNNEPHIDKAPLIDLATLNVAHYRNSADYEEGVFITGQDQLVMIGLTQEWTTKNFKDGVKLGSRSAIPLPVGADAKLLHAEPNNVAAVAMKHKEDQMKSIGAKLIEPTSSKGTATEALIEESSESSVHISPENQVSRGGQHGSIAGHGSRVNPLGLTRRHIHLGDSGESLRIGSGTKNGLPLTSIRGLHFGRHVQASIVKGDVKGVLARMISHGPIALGVHETDDVPVPFLFQDPVPVQVSLAGFHVDVGDVKFRNIEGKGGGPEKLALIPIEHPESSRLSHRNHDFPLLAARNLGVDPFHSRGIGIKGGSNEDSLLSVVGVPVIPGQMLVIPDQLTGFRIQGDGRIAVKFRGR